MADCLFCKIASHAIPSKALHEDELSLAFRDAAPQAPTHLLVIPKQHYDHVEEAPEVLLGHLLSTAARLGAELLPEGHRIVINTGEHGGQTVRHLHIHVVGGRHMKWPPG